MDTAIVSPCRLRPRARTALAGLVSGALVLVAAACGGAGSASGTRATPGPGAASPAGGTGAHAAMLAFAACMRSHGVPGFPDPAGGNLTIRITNGRADVNGRSIDVSTAQFRSAQQECRAKLPANPNRNDPAQMARVRQQALKYAACMRSHGVPGFPDPEVSGGNILIRAKGIDMSSPQFRAAQRACRSLSPLRGEAGGGSAGATSGR